MEKEITWITGDKREAKVTITLITSKELDADGDKIMVNCCEMQIRATVNGQSVGYGYPQTVNHPVAVAKIGSLGIAAYNMTKIDDAINEIKVTPAWVEKERRSAINEQVGKEYDIHRAKMRKVMGY